MLFDDCPVLIRGGGDLATGVAYRLSKSGFPVIVFEIANPLAIRRRVSLASAVLEDEIIVDEMHGILVTDIQKAFVAAAKGDIPVMVKSKLLEESEFEEHNRFEVIVDARMAKRNIDTKIDQAPLVVALGPGFKAGVDCHVVIETNRGHRLGRTIWIGSALADTGSPGIIMGMGKDRVLRSPSGGVVEWFSKIGEQTKEGDVLGAVAHQPVHSPFDGVIRGLIAPGSQVSAGLKIGDVDPRNDIDACFTISDKSLAVGGGVLEAILSWMNTTRISSG